jgi:transcriptional regulator with XRE-family HTH domain
MDAAPMDLDHLRREARLTVPKTLEIFNISPRTWSRWKRSGGPPWAHRLLRYEAGYLDELGWKRWQIRAGDLYCDDLHHSYKWSPGDLIADLVMPKKTKQEPLRAPE